jgi:anti-sigma B factor antagonist
MTASGERGEHNELVAPLPGLRLESIPDQPDVGAITVRLFGEIDVANTAALTEALEAVSEPGRRLVLDMAGVTFIDSSGINVLLRVASWAGERHDGLSVGDASANVRKILEILGLTDHFGLTG